MQSGSISVQSAPLHHARMMGERLQETINHLRSDIDRVDEPQFRAMFETAAEVLGGLLRAFQHYAEKSEEAWREQSSQAAKRPGSPKDRNKRDQGIVQDQRGQDQSEDKETAQR